MLTLLRSETVVLLLAFLTMEGHVYWNGALSIKECAYQQLKTKDAFSLHMVKDAANLLYAITGFLQRSVVKNVTCVVRRDFGMFLAKDCQKRRSMPKRSLRQSIVARRSMR